MPTTVFPGVFTSLDKIRTFVGEQAESAGFDKMGVYEVQLAVDEACANIIEHAYGGEGHGDIECTCETGKNEITITLRDWGAKFDPDKVPEYDYKNMKLEDLPDGGAGVMMMKRIMDEVNYTFSPKGNTLVLVKRA
jgi:serine/threonine-protein kinase RsbW